MVEKEINLRREVYRRDVEKIAQWMEDERVVEYLNEEQDISDQLNRLSRQSSLPVFSQQFNRNGSFFLVTLPDYGPIGFLRLVSKSEGAEIVIVIGESSQWGKGYGYVAIQQGLRRAFFQWREEKVIAKIHPDNERSKAVFKKAGFSKEKELQRDIKFSMTFDEFI